MAEHNHSLWPHFWNLLALFALTLITYGVSLIHLGPLADLVALAIAFVKVTLVIMIFMHVKEASRLVKVTAFGGFFWVFLFFAYLVGDVLTRDNVTWFEGWRPLVRKQVEAAPAHHGEDHGGGQGDEHGDGH